MSDISYYILMGGEKNVMLYKNMWRSDVIEYKSYNYLELWIT
jgi:hypothetical protein